MKFLILFMFVLTACSQPDDHLSSEAPADGEDGENLDLNEISGSRGGAVQGSRKLSVAKPADERDAKMNPLTDEEIYLSRQRRQKERKMRGFFASSVQNRSVVRTICRRFDGCQRFCSDWLNQNTHCNQWTVSTVAQVWSSMLDSMNSEQLIQHARWAAVHSDVSVFLRSADFEQKIMDKMILRLSQENCPFSEDLDIHHSANTERASLYLIHPEGRGKGVKKITDPEFFDIDVNIFKGSVNKCLDGNSLSELMLIHENTLGFQLMHQKIADSCAHKEECIQLAYCKINSEPVWTHLEQVKYSDAFNVEVQAEKCSYNDFNSLPSAL